MFTIPVYSIKGGVGKTTAAVNLACLAAEEGRSVAVWDLDPQGAASFYLDVESKLRGGVSRLMEKGHDLSSDIVSTSWENLDVVPSDFSLRDIDHYLDEGPGKTTKIKKLATGLEKAGYDILFIDSPPGITLLSENILRAGTILLEPLIPTILSERTHDELTDFCASKMPDLRILPFFSMVDKRKKMHLEYLMELDKRRTPFLKHFIPYSSLVEQMGLHMAPVTRFARWSFASRCYMDLWLNLKRYLRR